MFIYKVFWVYSMMNLLNVSCQPTNSSVRYIQNLSVDDTLGALEAASNVSAELECATEPIDEDKDIDGLIKYAGVFGGDGADYLQMLPDSGDLSVPAPPHIRVKRDLKEQENFFVARSNQL